MDARSISLRTASNMRVRSESLVAERDQRRHPQPIEQPFTVQLPRRTLQGQSGMCQLTRPFGPVER
jgi:hypothetical protein